MKQLGGWGENKPNKKKFPKQTFTLGFFFFLWIGETSQNITKHQISPFFFNK